MDTSAEKSLGGLRLLIVDDSDLILQLVTRYLKRWGVEAVAVENAQEALQLIAEPSPDSGTRPFDGVLMDLHLPDMDGTRAAVEIGRLQPDVPVIAMTGDESAPPVFSGYIRKPVRPEDLRVLITEVCGRE